MSQDFFHHFLEGLGKKGRKSVSDHLRHVVSGAPEVVVKVSGFTYDFAHLKRHFEYISRHGNLCLENEQGYEFRDPSEIESILQYWKKYHSSARKDVLRAENMSGKSQQNQHIRQGFTEKQDAENLNEKAGEKGRNSAKQSKGAEAKKGERTRGTSPQKRERLSAALVFSMPAGTDPLTLKNAVREFAQKTFKNYHYVMVLHEDADHPHIHLTLDMRGTHNRKLHIARGDPQKWREGFALALEAQNIPAEATPRKMRGITLKTPSQAMLHLKARGVKLEREKALISDLKALWRKSNLPAQAMDKGNDTGQNQEFTQKQQREQTKGQGSEQKTQQAIGAEQEINRRDKGNRQKPAQEQQQQENQIKTIKTKGFENMACVDARQKYHKNHNTPEENLQKIHKAIRHSWLKISNSYQQTDPVLSKMIVDFVAQMPPPVSRRELLQQKIFHSIRDMDKAQKLYHDHPELEPEILKILMAEHYAKQASSDSIKQEQFMHKLIENIGKKRLLGQAETIPVIADIATAQKLTQMQQKLRGQGEQHSTHAPIQSVSTRHRKKYHKKIQSENQEEWE